MKISVVMPVYNGERFLEDAIESVLDQTLEDFELIIINDGSTDNTEKIIEEYMEKDYRIICIKNRVNKGFDNWYNILNMGLKVARGEYIARMDADDICYPNRLEVQYNYLEKHKDIFLVGSSCDVIDKDGIEIDEIIKKPFPSILLKYRIAYSNSFIHPSIMFRNEGFEYPSSHERYFYFKLLINGKKLKNLAAKLIAYRINPHGLMSKHANLSENKYKDFYEDK